MTARMDRDMIGDWCAQIFPELYGRLDGPPAGPGGALYGEEFFTEAAGEVTAYVPIDGGPQRIPGGAYAVAVHAGPFVDFDRTYAALGSHVAASETAAPGPIREVFLRTPMSNTLSLGQIVIDAADAANIAGFWSGLLDRPLVDGANQYFAVVPRPPTAACRPSCSWLCRSRGPTRTGSTSTWSPPTSRRRWSGPSPSARPGSATSLSTAPDGRPWPTPRATSSTSSFRTRSPRRAQKAVPCDARGAWRVLREPEPARADGIDGGVGTAAPNERGSGLAPDPSGPVP
jgi:hypothetical protein